MRCAPTTHIGIVIVLIHQWQIEAENAANPVLTAEKHLAIMPFNDVLNEMQP
jgi:hypothetical protein